MIPFDFDYYLPDFIEEAFNLYRYLDVAGMKPLYYSGGTEIISMARVNNISTKAVIDLKKIPECNLFGIYDDTLIIGSCITLSRIAEADLFPLLTKTAGRIADHTNQCKITLGGNLNATIIYRETALPLMLCDATVVIVKDGGLSEVPFNNIFDKKMMLKPGEFVVQIKISSEYLQLPYIHAKKTKNEKIDYPLITVAALKKGERIRTAISGICSYPFRSTQLENCLNQAGCAIEERVDNAQMYLPEPPLDDFYGSGRYRSFVLKNTLVNVLQVLGR